MTTPPHTVSIVIPTSGRESLQQVQRGIALQTRAPDEVCIIRDHHRRGPGWARNRGIEQVQCDIIADVFLRLRHRRDCRVVEKLQGRGHVSGVIRYGR